MLSNSLSLVVLRGSTTLARLITLFIIARFVNTAEFGLVALTLSVVDIAKVVADFGIDTLAIREFAVRQDQNEIESFAKTIAIVKAMLGGLIYLLVISVFWLTQTSLQAEIMMIMGLLILTSLTNNFTLDYFQARLKVSRVLGPILIVNVLTILSVFVILSLLPILLVGIAILPLSEAINAFLLFNIFRREVPLPRSPIAWSAVRKLLRASLPIATAAIVVTIYTRMDVLVISTFFDDSTVAYYGVAFRVTEPFQLITLAFAASYYSYVSAALVQNRIHNRHRIYYYGLAGVLAYALVSCLLLTVFAPIAIKLVLPKYEAAIPILQVLAVAMVFRSLNAFLTSILQAHGRFLEITFLVGWNFVIIVALLLLLVPPMGAIGAAVVLLIAEITNSAIQLFLVRHYIFGKVNSPVSP